MSWNHRLNVLILKLYLLASKQLTKIKFLCVTCSFSKQNFHK